MKTCYYVVLYRPKDSSTWTPFPVADRGAGNFFASSSAAMDYATFVREHTIYLASTRQFVATEFKIGRVVIDNDHPDVSSKPK